jgi:hypothetical protein
MRKQKGTATVIAARRRSSVGQIEPTAGAFRVVKTSAAFGPRLEPRHWGRRALLVSAVSAQSRTSPLPVGVSFCATSRSTQ